MKRTYAFILGSTMLAATALTSCDTDTTTGVDVETTENEVDGLMTNENEMEGDTTNENISPLDTSETQSQSQQ